MTAKVGIKNALNQTFLSPGIRARRAGPGSGFGSKNLHLIGSGSGFEILHLIGSGSGFEILFFMWPEYGSKKSFYKNNIIFLVYF